MNRYIFQIMRILITQGFTNESLRDILHFYMENNVPLAYNLAWYDGLTENAVATSKHFTKETVTITVIQKL